MTTKMSFRHRWNLAYLADQRVPNARKFIVSFMMLEYANKNGTGAWPSEATLAERLGVSESTVKRAVAEAHKFGYLGRKRRFNDSNMYEATIPMSHEDLAAMEAEDQVDEALAQILTESQPVTPEPIQDEPDQEKLWDERARMEAENRAAMLALQNRFPRPPVAKSRAQRMEEVSVSEKWL